MLCKQCGYYAPDEALVCPKCGRVLESRSEESGAESIRQGKRAREAVLNRTAKKQEMESLRRKRRSGASHATMPLPPIKDTRETLPEFFDPMVDDLGGIGEDRSEAEETFERRPMQVYSEEAARKGEAAAYAARHAPGHVPAKMVNWFKVGLITFILVVFSAAGGYFFLKRTDPGQRLMARMGLEASSTALWKVGEELLDKGNIGDAIEMFEKASAQDKENGVVDVDGLLLLGSAYEADGRIDDAEKLYEEIYTETPSRTEAYVNHIRILLAKGDDVEGAKAKASELMKLAYERTGEASFFSQRNDFVPAPPEVDLTAGYYETKKYIAITSYQGYDVYYTFDENAELPSGGIKFTERVFLDEGIHTLRAVAVNGELVSDELRAVYRIIMPSPQTPRSSLAPATYKTRQRVRLKPGLDNENDDDIVIYYTVDGSSPDADSPVYTGEPFWLPGGRVTLKAVAVNKYSKVSNMLEILYKIEIPEPLRGYNSEEDAPKDFTLYVTGMLEFQRIFGEGTLAGEISVDYLETECRRYDYDWGYAIMSKTKGGWVLAEVCVTTGSGPIAGPRGTKVGDTEAFVVGKFRDMGQVESPSGNRGLYSSKDGTGKIWKQEDGGKIIRYRCYTPDSSHWWQLEYRTNANGIVTSIDMRYEP